MDIPILQTERLVMRQFLPDDFEAFADMNADPEVRRYLGEGGRVLDRAEAWRNMAMLIGHWHLRGYGVWAAIEKDTGEFIGRIGLHNPEGWPGLEVGWTLRRAFWKRGYATEGGRAALNYAFDILNADKVFSVIHPQNRASIKVAERLGLGFDHHNAIFSQPVVVYSIKRPALVSTPPSR